MAVARVDSCIFVFIQRLLHLSEILVSLQLFPYPVTPR